MLKSELEKAARENTIKRGMSKRKAKVESSLCFYMQVANESFEEGAKWALEWANKQGKSDYDSACALCWEDIDKYLRIEDETETKEK